MVVAEAIMAAAAAALVPVSVALVRVSAALVQVSAALVQESAAGAAVVGMAMYTALECTADAHFLDAASAAVAVAAEAGGAAELAGYGHPLGAGSTPAGASPHLRLR